VLEDATAYTYLVNDHWRPGVTYPALALGDPTVAIDWPIPLGEAIISEKDQNAPALDPSTAMAPKKTLIVGALGQLGRALFAAHPDADRVDLFEGEGVTSLDLTDSAAVAAWPWHEYAVVLNAAAYTAVDAAETTEGRVAAWAANATGPATLARLAREHRFTLVHYSSEYVFDGTVALDPGHVEDEPLSPLGVYAQSKAAGDLAVGLAPRHYLIRTSWVIGEGKNFVRTMRALADKGVSPSVVDDQVGRPTFAADLAAGVRHLLHTAAPFGTYNLTCDGDPASRADVAAAVFAARGRRAEDVVRIRTEDYVRDRPGIAPRPLNSVLDLARIRATGFRPRNWRHALETYLTSAP
jgi:dTDP-4-dehydrorhamnose reductase